MEMTKSKLSKITASSLGGDFEEVTVAKWLKEPGEAVEEDDILVELETDKVAVEITAEEAGLLNILVEEGSIVSSETVLATVSSPSMSGQPSSTEELTAVEDERLTDDGWSDETQFNAEDDWLKFKLMTLRHYAAIQLEPSGSHVEGIRSIISSSKKNGRPE